jgi:hypothetical protein
MAKAITTNQRAIASFQVICMPESLSFSPLLKSLNLLTIFRTKLRKHNYATNYQTEIKIPLNVAQNYWDATEEERQKMEEKIAFYLQSSTLSRKESLDKLYKTMATIGQKAQERGLTPEILESLLNEDD